MSKVGQEGLENVKSGSCCKTTQKQCFNSCTIVKIGTLASFSQEVSSILGLYTRNSKILIHFYLEK